MVEARNPLVKLQDLQRFLAIGTVEYSPDRLAALAAELVGATSCSIMLLNTGEGDDLRMRVVGRHGSLPDAALDAAVARGEGIAGLVLASGSALCIADVGHSDYAGLARHGLDAGSLVCAPIRIDGRIAGVLNAARPAGLAPFGDTDVRLLDVVALFIGKSVQVQQLQRLLDSRFAQLALLQDARSRVEENVRTAYRNPEDVARILARSFFREMTKAGFESAQIVSAASELIDQLHLQLQEKKAKS